jgi:hypothetical protein
MIAGVIMSQSSQSVGVAKKATNRVSAQNLSRMAKQLGRCGDIEPTSGWVCVTQPHADDVEHLALQIGGPFDGHIYARWGGRLPNNLVIPTQAVPTDV